MSRYFSVCIMMWSSQLLVLCALVYGYGATPRNILVTTPLGKIEGTTLTTRLGKTIYAFRGIRYAKPPINELRFQPPSPVEKWSGIYNATVDGPVCPQPSADPISEDCLMLNIYTTQLPQNARNSEKRPVIMHLHAGGFYGVTGRSNWAGPQYFLDRDIVLITLNYRLATLGFLSLGEEAPGNNGLRDQVMAMKWVRDNIASFGGDPNSVTLYGYSAGAWSITLHMVSPMSRGLFHKAIIGSGSALGHFPLPKNQLDLAKRQARFVGCPDTDPKEILACLKTTPAEDLGNSLSQFSEFGNEPVLRWSPVIEEDFGQERFLTDDPIKLFQTGNFEQIPVVTGVTIDEFADRAFPLVNNATLLQKLNDNFQEYAPICFIYERGTNKSKQVSECVRSFYLNNETLSNASLTSLTKIYADSIVGFPVYRTVNLIAEKSTKPVYYYEFSYQGRYSHFYLPGTNGTQPYGVVHHDDLIYLFYISPLFPFFNSSFPETEMVEKLSLLWATFAKTGNPIDASNDDFDGVKWTPYNCNTKKYLDIGKQLVLRDNLFDNRYSFWEKLYPLSN